MGQKLTCLQGAGSEIRTAGDLARFMGRLMYDIARGSISTKEANSICRAAEMIIRLSEAQLEYGWRQKDGKKPQDVQLCGPKR